MKIRQILQKLHPPRVSVVAETETGEEKPLQALVRAVLNWPGLSYYLVLGSTLALLGIGLLTLFSVSSVQALASDVSPLRSYLRTLLIAVLGLGGMVGLSIVPSRWFPKVSVLALIVGCIGQMGIMTPLARSEGGNTNWVLIPGINQTVQPSEFLKIALALYLAGVLVRYPLVTESWREALKYIVFPTVLVSFLIIYGHDLGTLMIVAVLIFGVLFIANIPWRWVGAITLTGAGLVSFAIMVSPSRRHRIRLFFSGGNGADPLGDDMQPIHSKWGLGTGGLTGVGVGSSREKWGYLPAAHSDYIFAIYGEEFGFLGAMVLLLLFALLAYGMFRIVVRHHNDYARFYVGAVMCWVMAQALVNIFVVVGLLPVLGVPLPLLSGGGSALLATLFAIGIVLNFARSEPGAEQALRSPWRRRGRARAVVAQTGG